MLLLSHGTEGWIFMSKTANAFKNGKAFIAFLTAGDPSLEKTAEYAAVAAENGADLIELGIPFSDPIADGPVIQAANLRALKGGATLEKIFDTVVKIREKTQIPIVFLTYLNPVFRYGYDRFFAKCREIGADGLIIPDLPFEEKAEVRRIADKYEIDIISLIAPTSEDRIKKIAADASGFVYIVSSMGVTGVRRSITTDISAIVGAVKAATNVPSAVGFGISTPEQAAHYSQIADGVIVGSAIVKLVEQYGENAAEPIAQYVRSMKNAVRCRGALSAQA